MTTPAAGASVAPRTVADLVDSGDVAAQVAAIELLTAAVTARSAAEQAVTTDATVLGRASITVTKLCDRLAAQRLGWLAVVEADGRWMLDTVRTYPHWVALEHGTSLQAAYRDVRAARRLRDHLPATADAARTGTITLEHLRALTRAADTDARRAALAGPAADDENAPDGAPRRDAGDAGDASVPDGKEHARGADGHGPQSSDAAESLTVEEVLVGLAQQHRIEPFRTIAARFADLADPDAADRAYTDAAAQEYLNVSRTLGGYHLDGFLTDEHGHALTTALNAVTARRAAQDTRTPAHRRAGALHTLTRLALDQDLTLQARHADRGTLATADPEADAPAEASGEPASTDVADEAGAVEANRRRSGTARPHITVVVTAADLERALARAHRADQGAAAGDDQAPGAATSRRRGHPPLPRSGPWSGGRFDWREALSTPPAQYVDTTGPVPDAVLRRLACDGELARVLLGPASDVLNVGRRQRTVTGPRREAVVARDRHCVWPGCEEPPHRCEVHHAQIPWAGLGDTSTDNGALLCWYHHDQVDTHHITLTWPHDGWALHRADGTAIETERSRWLHGDDEEASRNDGPHAPAGDEHGRPSSQERAGGGPGSGAGRGDEDDGPAPPSRAVAAAAGRAAITARVPDRPAPDLSAADLSDLPGAARPVPDVVSQVELLFAGVLSRYG